MSRSIRRLRLALPVLIAVGTATALAVPRAGGQFMVAAGPATRRMRVVRVPTRAGGERGRRGGRRRIPAERRQQLFRTGLYQRRRADLARAGHRRPGHEPRRGARPGRPGRHGMGWRTI
jgi:hypothetical protein